MQSAMTFFHVSNVLLAFLCCTWTHGAEPAEEHPLGEWYAVGRQCAQEADPTYRSFGLSSEETMSKLPNLLVALGVDPAALRTEEYKLLTQGWSDRINGLPAAYTYPATQQASKVPAALRGFHTFHVVAGRSGGLSPDDIEKLQKGVVRVRTPEGHGSGFFISPDHVLTNQHVIAGHDSVKVSNDFSGLELTGTIVAKSDPFDLALIKIENGDQIQRSVLEIGDSTSARTGDEIALFGYPLVADLNITTTFGRISARRSHAVTGSGDAFQLSGAEANPGNSGGPLVNNQGQVIGILTFGFDHFTNSRGFTFCVDVAQARDLLKKHCPEALVNFK